MAELSRRQRRHIGRVEVPAVDVRFLRGGAHHDPVLRSGRERHARAQGSGRRAAAIPVRLDIRRGAGCQLGPRYAAVIGVQAQLDRALSAIQISKSHADFCRRGAFCRSEGITLPNEKGIAIDALVDGIAEDAEIHCVFILTEVARARDGLALRLLGHGDDLGRGVIGLNGS